MNNFARAHNSYLEPPDDDPICEDGCGETLVRDMDGSWYCPNKFCPLKFQGTEQAMAYALAEYKRQKKEIFNLREHIEELKWKIQENNK